MKFLASFILIFSFASFAQEAEKTLAIDLDNQADLKAVVHEALENHVFLPQFISEHVPQFDTKSLKIESISDPSMIDIVAEKVTTPLRWIGNALNYYLNQENHSKDQKRSIKITLKNDQGQSAVLSLNLANHPGQNEVVIWGGDKLILKDQAGETIYDSYPWSELAWADLGKLTPVVSEQHKKIAYNSILLSAEDQINTADQARRRDPAIVDENSAESASSSNRK